MWNPLVIFIVLWLIARHFFARVLNLMDNFQNINWLFYFPISNSLKKKRQFTDVNGAFFTQQSSMSIALALKALWETLWSWSVKCIASFWCLSYRQHKKRCFDLWNCCAVINETLTFYFFEFWNVCMVGNIYHARFNLREIKQRKNVVVWFVYH